MKKGLILMFLTLVPAILSAENEIKITEFNIGDIVFEEKTKQLLVEAIKTDSKENTEVIFSLVGLMVEESYRSSISLKKDEILFIRQITDSSIWTGVNKAQRILKIKIISSTNDSVTLEIEFGRITKCK